MRSPGKWSGTCGQEQCKGTRRTAGHEQGGTSQAEAKVHKRHRKLVAGTRGLEGSTAHTAEQRFGGSQARTGHTWSSSPARSGGSALKGGAQRLAATAQEWETRDDDGRRQWEFPKQGESCWPRISRDGGRDVGAPRLRTQFQFRVGQLDRFGTAGNKKNKKLACNRREALFSCSSFLPLKVVFGALNGPLLPACMYR